MYMPMLGILLMFLYDKKTFVYELRLKIQYVFKCIDKANFRINIYIF